MLKKIEVDKTSRFTFILYLNITKTKVWDPVLTLLHVKGHSILNTHGNKQALWRKPVF